MSGNRVVRRPVLTYLLAGLCLLTTSTVAWGRAIPAFQGYVNDYANLISPAAEQELTTLLAAFDQSDSTQVAILTVDSLEGEDIEGFSIRTVDQWKVGQKGKDNGVLLLVAKQERKIRIEVGRGLEGVLTDLLSGRIIDQAIAPAFRTGEIDQGFMNGANAIIAATRGEFKAEPRSRRTGGKAPPIVSYLFVALLLVAFLGNVSKKLGAGAGALLLPLAAYGGMGAALPLLFLLLLIPAGLLAGIIAPLVLNAMASGHGGYYGGGFGSGGGGGGGGFGGFGGGGFGGGGASGGW